MSILDWFRRNPPAAEPEPDEFARAMAPPPYHFDNVRKGLTATGNQPTPSKLLSDGFAGTAATAANAIANRVSDLDFTVQKRGVGEDGSKTWEDVESPLLDTLYRPNPLLSQRQMLKLASYWLTLSGEAFWLIVRNGGGKVVELWPMAPSHMEKLSTDIQPVAGFVFHGESGETHYGLEEVVWMFDPDPADPFAGVGKVGPQARDFDAGTFASSTMRTYFEHDASPKVILRAETEADLPDSKQKRAFYADWTNRYNRRNGENVGVPAFLPSGFSAQELGQGSSGVSETREFMEYQRDLILMATGVPRSILGDVVDANRAAAETNQFVFDRHTISPQSGLIADALTHQLAVPELGADHRVAFEEFVSADEAFRLSEEKQDLDTKVRTINQVREDRGLPPVDWGDDPIGTFADTPYTGEEADSPQEPGKMKPGAPEAPSQLGGDDEPADEEDNTPDDPAGRAFISRMVTPRIAARLTADAIWQRSLTADALYIPRMVSALRGVFGAQKAMTLKALAEAQPSRSYSRADWLDELFALPDFSRLFDVAVTPLEIEIFRTEAESMNTALEQAPRLEFHQKAIDEMRDNGADLVTLANATTKRALRKTLTEGVEAGDSLQQMEKRVRAAYSGISKRRARTIARTEVGFATSKGHVEAYDQGGIVTHLQWNTALDERVRDQHVAMQGERVVKGDPFTIPAAGKAPREKALMPRVSITGGRLSPHNGINCRCFETAVLGD